MTEKRNEIMRMFVALGEFYRIQVQRHQAEMYAKAIEDLPMEKIAAAVKTVQRTNKFFPMPAEIREIALGNSRDEALEVSSRIVAALSRFGWNNPERAREFIGELGWHVVEREGGWRAVCERTSNDDLPALKAQWRELARATHAMKNQNNAPLVEASRERTAIPGHVGNVIGDIVKKASAQDGAA